ncbi:MAG TPA: PTS sugar transporter subunit IIA [Tepidisphaeraceae bacterium]|jgi:fructose-specific phosphotransferase system IIA component
MRLSDILKPQNIKVAIPATTKLDVIRDLVDLLAQSGEISDPKKVLESVLERESTRTTGIGNGLAIPHGKSGGTDHLVMAIGKPEKPIDFHSIDGRPVTIVWMLISPPDQSGVHIKALAAVSRLMTSDKFRFAINGAGTPEDLYEIVRKQEAGS